MGAKAKHPFHIRPQWWLGQAALILMGGFFLVLGVQLLMAAYALPDPFTFIMTFFAACLIILISATLLIGFIVRLHSVYRHLKAPPPPAADPAAVEAPAPPEGASGDAERPAESQGRWRR
jgi:predicted permease